MESINESVNEEQKGISFMTALERRYADISCLPKEVLNLPQNEGNDRSIELIGFESISKLQRNFERLIEVNVSKMNISFCDNDCKQIEKALIQTKTLILSNNLLNSWTQIAKIVKNTPSLTDLVLSYNKIKLPTDEEVVCNSFKSIKTLIMDNIDYDWNDIEYCAQMWDQIERLDVWGNGITRLNTPEPISKPILFYNLQHLSLCNNDIKSWLEVCKLGYLPELKTLNVSNCNLIEIRFEDSNFNNKTKLFTKLESLLINNNKLMNWRDIAELNKFEKLENLIIKNNPVFDNEKYDTNFNLILARIENLKFLNREPVTEFMRRDAEIGYLRKFFKEFNSIKSISNKLEEFMCNNPRFENIITKYGSPSGSENETKAELDKKKFLTVNITAAFDEQKNIEKRLPANISILNLKTIIRRLFNIDFNNEIELLWTSQQFKCPLDKEAQNLNFYSIENGDTILVNIK